MVITAIPTNNYSIFLLLSCVSFGRAAERRRANGRRQESSRGNLGEAFPDRWLFIGKSKRFHRDLFSRTMTSHNNFQKPQLLCCCSDKTMNRLVLLVFLAATANAFTARLPNVARSVSFDRMKILSAASVGF